MRRLAAGLSVALLLAGATAAQEAAAARRLAGVVTDLPGRPVAGAAIEISPLGEGSSPTWRATSEADGTWALVGPTPGRWAIAVRADGYFTARGHVDVREGATPPVAVGLRGIDEVSPAFSEGHPATVAGWLERGNDLLEQGRPAAARAEYGKALAALPPAERPEVLQAIARTHFLEGAVDAAVADLEAALRLAPDDGAVRRLYRALQGELGRERDAQAFLARLEAGAEPPSAEPETVAPPPPAEAFPAVATRLAAEPARLDPARPGHQRVRLTTRSPLSSLETFLARSHRSEAEVRALDPDPEHDLREEAYQLYLPAGEPPADGWGLLVWVSPTPFGGFTRPGIAELLERRRIVWVGADHAGNPRPIQERRGLALDAATSLAAALPIHPRRVWVGGYSGGGRTAAQLATLYPEAFRGALCWFGVDHFHQLAVPYRPGARWPSRFPPPEGEALATVRAQGRFVFVTGSRDFNRAESWSTWRHLAEEDGFRRATLLEIPGADHYFGLRAEWLGRALAALDE